MTTSQDQLAQAQNFQQQGRTTDALALYQRVLGMEPRNAEALHLYGVTLARMGRLEDALPLLAAAVDVQPANPVFLTNFGNALNEQGRHADAAVCFDRAITLRPDLGAAYRGRGIALLHLRRLEAALSNIDQALRFLPNVAQVHNDRGNVLRALGRSAEALISYDRALMFTPDDASVYHDRGMALVILERHSEALASFDRCLKLAPPGQAPTHLWRGKTCLRLSRLDEALASFERAAALAPAEFESHFHHGMVLTMLNRHTEALASFDKVLAINPQSAETLNNRGVALGRLLRSDEALTHFNRALLLKPDYAEAHTNAGNELRSLRRFAEAAQHFDAAVDLKADDPSAVWSKALLKLILGEFREGWPLHEARFRLTHLGSVKRSFLQPRWSGTESLEGKTLLVHAEQGLGDTLQFCRYIQSLEALGTAVVFEAQASLVPLLKSFPMRGVLCGFGEPLPDFDYHCPLLSLPLAFGTEVGSIPGGVPYIHADPARVRSWCDRLAPVSGLRVGLNWQGNLDTEKQPWVRGRSFPLALAEPLARIDGVQLISLQMGRGAEQRDQVPFKESLARLFNPFDMGAESMLETAALIAALDLVITSDTAVAHLAGAMGVAVWVVLQAVPDWRWLMDRDDSPWYPSMLLFRQHDAGDWQELFVRVAANLRSVAANPTVANRPVVATRSSR